ncbi:putative transporter YycB [Oceanobacillus oncorhynchi subsp. incaldanensis]|uniref:CynX/NimT family MFS transporter n=3 Tax=Oceanobacillus TaxID=182709 RepID=A0ABV9K184_9BACI|nr:putative transporter YycB [Oceanobacillus oncorhynchi subsp. incaldanensis]CEI83614.1 putative transporter YycB [Oceanobacillus oncorhynchi]
MEKNRARTNSLTEEASSNKRMLYLIAIMVIGFNLRPAITSVGPLLGTIRDQIGLENWSAGTITSLPLIAFAIVSPLAPKLGRKLGNEGAVLLGLILLFAGIGTRSIPYTPTLFIGTAIIGVGIAVMNVLLPAVIKEKFPHKVGQMTSVYSTSMAIFAATASGLSVPLAKGAGLGWELALLSWAVLALVGIIVWIFVISRNPAPKEEQVELSNKPFNDSNLWKSPLAWQVTLFMGLQSFIFYVMVSWLPEIMQSFGFSVSAAGWLIAYVQFVGLPSTFLAPVLAEKFSNQQGIVLGISGGAAVGFIGLLIGGPLPLIFIWVTLIGVTFGGAISLSLAMLGMRARNGRQAGALSGMAQSVGYIFAAIGPLFIGLLFDITQAWSAPIIAIIVVCLLMMVAGLGAGRNKFV